MNSNPNHILVDKLDSDETEHMDQLEFLVDDLENATPIDLQGNSTVCVPIQGPSVDKLTPMRSLDMFSRKHSSVQSINKFAPTTLKNNTSEDHETDIAVPKKVVLNIMAPLPGATATRNKQYKRLASIAGLFNNNQNVVSGLVSDSNTSAANFVEPEVLPAPTFPDDENPIAKVEVQESSPAPVLVNNISEEQPKTPSEDNTGDSSFDPEEKAVLVKQTTTGCRRRAKRARKSAVEAEDEVIDQAAIQSALDAHKARPEGQPRRGRKPVKEDVYITSSLVKIDEMEARLVNEKATLTPDERDQLRNKASALRSRVNRKLEHRNFNSKLANVLEQFEAISQIIAEEMDSDTRKRCMSRLAGNPEKRANTSASHSKADFVKRAKEFVNSVPH